uniref:Uncharacterized protein n=1 Tax=Caenorhabditis japonica TaxID=281687 RepID=A0A8R1I2T3_CAEJA
MKKMSISPIEGELRIDVEEQMEIREEEEEDAKVEKESSTILKLVLILTIPYVLILPIFTRNLHDWYSTTLLCLLICFTLDLTFIAVRFYAMLRPLSSIESAALVTMLLFYAKHIFMKYESPINYLLFFMFFLLLIPAFYRCFLLLKLKTSHKRMFKAMVEDDF